MQLNNLTEKNHRILIIDDNRAIHEDLRKVLANEGELEKGLQADEAILFGSAPVSATEFEIDSAYQGQEGLEMVVRACAEGRPYALAFVDIRMPPGWDGVETIGHLQKADPHLQTVICTAYSDYSWKDIQRRLGHSDSLLILKKPFDNIEVIQLAHALTRKWLLSHQAEARMADLDRLVAERTAELREANGRIQRELEERAKAETAFRTIFEASPIGITLRDADGLYLDVNAAFETQHGIPKAMVVGHSVLELAVLDPDTFDTVTKKFTSEGFLNGHEVDYRHASGNLRTALLWLRRVQIGTASYSLGFWLDITARKKAEESLRAARTAAETASKAKSEFLANMSHEIRTPINGILGFTQLTLGSPLTADQKDYLETVENCTKSLLEVINQILDFSKIEAGRMELECSPFSLVQCVKDATRTFEAAAQQKGLALSYQTASGELDQVVGDSTRLRQVLLNLIGNSIKFTARGSVRIYARVALGSEKECLVHFEVQDTGIGIPVDKQRYIFEPFRQGEGSTTRKYGGTGLGLAISARLVELMGGRIWVESEEGRGSSFHFTAAFKPAGDVRKTYSPQDADRTDRTRPLSVMVVEDDAVSQDLICTLLRNAGHRLTIASNGFEVLSKLRERPFDLILMDVQMPEMDGFETTREIRRRDSLTGAHTPVVAVTAHSMKGDRERCLEVGMDGYISKPIQVEALFAVLSEVANECESAPVGD